MSATKHPIIYVRGFAISQGEIEETVADPYMGFNTGSTKQRQAWTGDVKRFYFESPLVRLMSDHGYVDVFDGGDDLISGDLTNKRIPYQSIIIYRYYDDASNDFGDGETPPMEHFAKGLDELILRLSERVCADPKNKITLKDFKVHLVAHSMGGLICRAFLQNPALGTAKARKMVDKVFTYATPHNGIDMRVVRNVPGWLSFGDVNNFNRSRMAEYLGLKKPGSKASVRAVSEVKDFPADRIFNLVGTNPADYTVAKGLSSWAVGDASDGLVRVENAVTHGKDSQGNAVTSPAAWVHRSHSGHYGIVNSEEGYQNLTRFLFGALRADGFLDVDDISLPVEVANALADGKTVNASYHFESLLVVRGTHWELSRRSVRENSAIFRSYDQLFPKTGGGSRPPDRGQSPHLFTVFLDPSASVKASGAVSFAFDLRVLVPDYEVDGSLFLKRHYEGGYIYNQRIIVEAVPEKGQAFGWRVKYGLNEINPGKPGVEADVSEPSEGGLSFAIPVKQSVRPGLTGHVRINLRPWG